MKRTLIVSLAGLCLAACAQPSTETPAETPAAPAAWAFEDGEIFPADRSLQRPESGVVLADGTVVVVDQRTGLAAIAPDGSVRPYGNFSDAGYSHLPPDYAAGPNGAAFEPDGRHILTADVFTGSLYRTDTETETTTLIYQHPFGINYARRDSTGAIWFTQSTENAPPNSEERLFAAIDAPIPDGGLFRIAPVPDDASLPEPEAILSGLAFANGFVIDEGRGQLYLAETVGGRILGYRVDLATGALTGRRVVAEVLTPDNVEQDAGGRLWVASPMSSAVMQVDPETGETRKIFSAQTDAGAAIVTEFVRRGEAGEPALDLLGPDVWEPMPGLVTGIILAPGGGPIYISGLGDALLKISVPE